MFVRSGIYAIHVLKEMLVWKYDKISHLHHLIHLCYQTAKRYLCTGGNTYITAWYSFMGSTSTLVERHTMIISAL